MNRSTAEIIREYGPFPGVEKRFVTGVTWVDGESTVKVIRRPAGRGRAGNG
jgi:hypothetical protein